MGPKWRYNVKGDLPNKQGVYLVKLFYCLNPRENYSFFDGGYFHGAADTPADAIKRVGHISIGVLKWAEWEGS